MNPTFKRQLKDVTFYSLILLFAGYVWWVLFGIFKWNSNTSTAEAITLAFLCSAVNGIVSMPFFISIFRKSKNIITILQNFKIKYLITFWKISIVTSYIVVLYELNIIIIGLLFMLTAYTDTNF
jgi:hypothetical protein